MSFDCVIKILPLLVFMYGLPVFADGEAATSNTITTQTSDSDQDRKLLPGEEVTTSSGKKMKVWSTRGPVPVSRAPEPFEDREKTVINGSNIIIDAETDEHRRPHNNHRANGTIYDNTDQPGSRNSIEKRGAGDSFDIRK